MKRWIWDLVEILEIGCIRQIEGTSGRNISDEMDVSRRKKAPQQER